MLAALGAVAAFACLGKVLSPQYLVWTVPLGALAFAWRQHALALAVALATLLTQVEFPAPYFELVDRERLPRGARLRSATRPCSPAVALTRARATAAPGRSSCSIARGAALAVRLD